MRLPLEPAEKLPPPDETEDQKKGRRRRCGSLQCAHIHYRRTTFSACMNYYSNCSFVGASVKGRKNNAPKGVDGIVNVNTYSVSISCKGSMLSFFLHDFDMTLHNSIDSYVHQRTDDELVHSANSARLKRPGWEILYYNISRIYRLIRQRQRL